jgi:hypothetical protein
MGEGEVKDAFENAVHLRVFETGSRAVPSPIGWERVRVRALSDLFNRATAMSARTQLD